MLHVQLYIHDAFLSEITKSHRYIYSFAVSLRDIRDYHMNLTLNSFGWVATVYT